MCRLPACVSGAKKEMDSTSCGSLWRSYEIVLETEKSIHEKKVVEEQILERKKLARLEDLCMRLINRSASSLLADLDDAEFLKSTPSIRTDPVYSTLRTTQEGKANLRRYVCFLTRATTNRPLSTG